MIENLNGLCTKEITLLASEEVKPGMPVEIIDKYTVGMAGINGRFFGVCTSVKGKYATVAISGAVTIPYSGSEIYFGYNTISSDGEGKVKFDIDGEVYYVVLDIDEDNNLITILLDK